VKINALRVDLKAAVSITARELVDRSRAGSRSPDDSRAAHEARMSAPQPGHVPRQPDLPAVKLQVAALNLEIEAVNLKTGRAKLKLERRNLQLGRANWRLPRRKSTIPGGK